MNKKKELTKNTIILLVGKICTQFISFLLLPLYTAVLATDEYGIVDLVITYVGLLAPIITLQLEMGVFRFLIDCRNDKDKKTSIITNVLIFSLMLLFISFIPIYIVCSIINFEYTIYLIVMILISGVTGIVLQTIRGIGDSVGYSVACVISGALNIILNVIFLAILHFGIEGMFLAQIISNLVCLIYLCFKMKLFNLIKINSISKNTIFDLLRYSIPLIPNGIIWWIINASDRTIISIFLNASANGIYAISNKFSNVFISVYNIYNMSWTESVSLHINDNDKFISDTINESLIFFASMCICLIAVMPFIFPIMIGDNYADSYQYIPILLISTFFNIFASLIGALYIAKKKTFQISLTSFISGVINIIVNILFINKIGIYAAAISTLIAFIVMVVYRYFDVKKYININFNKMEFLIIIVAFGLESLIYYLNNVYINIINLAIVLILCFVLNKNVLMNFFKIIFKLQRKNN